MSEATEATGNNEATYRIRITVIHALGTFSGILQPENPTYQVVDVLLQQLQDSINRLERLVLLQDDGSEIAFQESILKKSILTFVIEEVND
jgi:hypothetical protein